MHKNNLEDKLEKLNVKDLKKHEKFNEYDNESILVSDDSGVSSLDDYQ